MAKTLSISTFLLLGILQYPLAQKFSFTHYNIRNGLAGSIAHGIAQDGDGFLWLATETGLSRFDGHHFKNYTTSDGLPGNEVLGLYPDSKQRLWIAVFRNTVCYLQGGKIHTVKNDSLPAKIRLNSYVNQFGEDDSGNIFIRSIDRLFRVDHKNQVSVQQVEHTNLSLKSLIEKIRKPGTRPIMLYKLNPHWMRAATTNAEWHKSYDGAWAAANADSIYIENKQGASKRYDRSEGFTGIRFLNSQYVLLIREKGGGDLFYLPDMTVVARLLDWEKINFAYCDTEDNFWFSTNGSGIYKLNSIVVKNYTLQKSSLSLQALCIMKQGSAICIGAENNSFWRLVPASGKVLPARLALEGNSRQPGFFNLPGRGRLINPSQQIFDPYTSVNRIPYPGAVKTLVTYGDSILISCGNNALLLLPPRHGKRKTLLLMNERTTCAMLHENRYFIGTPNGALIMDTGRHKEWIPETRESRIGFMARGPGNTLWIASFGSGIFIWKENRIVAALSTADGLLSNNCRTLFMDGNTVWAGTEKGLNKIDCSSGRYRVVDQFNSADGLGADMINAVYADGPMVYVATSAGISVFDETRMQRQSESRLCLTAIHVSGKAVSLPGTGLSLQPKDNNIRFEYAGISFKSEGQIQFRYRLMGLDTQWRSTGETSLEYPTLPAGNYRLDLVAVNRFGKQSVTLHFAFTIQQTLFRKTWFRISLLAVLLLALGSLAQWQVRRIRKKEKQKTAMSRRLAGLEHQALRAQMNPHFIFNTLNAVNQYVMNKDMRGANTFITDFSNLIRLTFENSGRAKITVRQEIDYLRTYLDLEKVKYENRFQYRIEAGENMDRDELFIPPMLLQPFVENSIRHGFRGLKDREALISIRFETENGKLLCRVDDNGMGRSRAKQEENISKESSPHGIMLTQERIRIWAGQSQSPIELTITDKQDAGGNATGTLVSLSIPLTEAINPR